MDDGTNHDWVFHRRDHSETGRDRVGVSLGPKSGVTSEALFCRVCGPGVDMLLTISWWTTMSCEDDWLLNFDVFAMSRLKKVNRKWTSAFLRISGVCHQSVYDSFPQRKKYWSRRDGYRVGISTRTNRSFSILECRSLLPRHYYKLKIRCRKMT